MPRSRFLWSPVCLFLVCALLLPAAARAQDKDSVLAELRGKQKLCSDVFTANMDSLTPERHAALRLCARICGASAQRIDRGQSVAQVQPLTDRCRQAFDSLPAEDRALLAAPAEDFGPLIADLREKSAHCAAKMRDYPGLSVNRRGPSLSRCQTDCDIAAGSIEESGRDVGFAETCVTAFEAIMAQIAKFDAAKGKQ